MHSLVALLLAVAAACAIARPGPSIAPKASRLREDGMPARSYLSDFILPRLIMPRYFGFEESPRVAARREMEHEWLDKEISRISEMAAVEEALHPYEVELTRWVPPDSYKHAYNHRAMMDEIPKLAPETRHSVFDIKPNENTLKGMEHKSMIMAKRPRFVELEQKKAFALTPLDQGYYEAEVKVQTQQSEGPHEGGGSNTMQLEPPRQIRQNPNLSKSRTLVSENMNQVRTAFQEQGADGTAKPSQVQVLEVSDPADSIYGVALIAAVGSSLAMAIFGFAFGWYTLSKKAKAAADVDYPAYGVTGPTLDTSGDRKLAHSAHMYHYQHQKQQIIAMERNGLEQGTGSVSDPESEEENEEGDYTVYECPGFASTGDIEVKNPLFSEDPTPATPGKCEMVKPQPKD